jgi:heterodisulfide reductase subunit B
MNRYFDVDYKMPIVFFTQLMGLAFGKKPQELGFGKEIVSAAKALNKIGLEAPVPESTTPPKKVKKTGLPMPGMPGSEEEQ